jgi:hypothetical protein
MAKTSLINQAKNAGMNSGATVLAKMRRLSELKKHPELESVFSIQPGTLAAIVESMKQNGYDNAQPIVNGKIDGEWYIVDGYTRYEAASQAGIEEAPVDEKEFESLEAAIRYCFRRQAERRNLSQAEIYNAAERLDIPAEKLAKELGVGVSNITRAKKIGREAEPEDIEAIKNNEKTINSVYNKIKKSKPKGHYEPDDDDEPDVGGEIEENNDPELEESGENREESGDGPGGDILDGAITESETTGLEPGAPDDTAAQIIMEIVGLLSENGEASAVTVIQNAYPEIFNEGGDGA